MTHDELMKLAETGELTEDVILRITQETRRGMLTKMIQDGIPTDSKSSYRLMKLMEDMDATALNTKKIESDDKNADADRKAALTLAAIGQQLQGGNPFAVNGGKAPSIDSVAKEIPNHNVSEDEKVIGISTMTYDEFTKE